MGSRGRSAGVAALAITATIALGGCGLVGSSSSTATPAPQSSLSSALKPLTPNYPTKLTEAAAKTETVRLAGAIQGLIQGVDIVNVDNTSKLVAATKSAGAYWGVLRVVTTTDGFDAITQATAMEKLLASAGWVERQTSPASDSYAALMSSTDAGGVSLLLLRADTTPKAPPVVSIQLESPDLPK